MKFAELVPILQLAIGPVILISGVGLLLLSMTNRLGRVVDRSRILAEALRKMPAQEDRERLQGQLHILARRAHLIRLAITLATSSVLLAALLVIAIFFSALFQWQAGLPKILIFVGCLLSLIGAVIVFLMDLNLSLAALELETRVKD